MYLQIEICERCRMVCILHRKKEREVERERESDNAMYLYAEKVSDRTKTDLAIEQVKVSNRCRFI